MALFFYDLLDKDGNFVEKRCYPQLMKVGPGADGEMAFMVPSSAPIIDPKVLAQQRLDASDGQGYRVLEDLITALTSKGLLTANDLPAAAKAKLAQRAADRTLLSS